MDHHTGRRTSILVLPGSFHRLAPALLLRPLRRILYGLGVLAVGLVAAELTARLDDWISDGVALGANPDFTRDLFVTDGGIRKGRPHAQYKKWRLNGFGFRSPEMAQEPAPGRTRVLVLGASETFGLYESEGKEFPAQLGCQLQAAGTYEVINAAIPGMTIHSMVPYWEMWLARFHPGIVVIYPSPLFYLAEQAPGAAGQPRAETAETGTEFRSRFAARMKDAVVVPAFVQQWRTARKVAALTAGKEESWFLRSVPAERLDLFAADLHRLTAAIRAHGAKPVLLTHAIRSSSPPRPEDAADLLDMRVFRPHVSEEVLVKFEKAANQRIVSCAREEGIAVIDVDRAMSGRREWFADLVHFSDAGAATIAELIGQRFASTSQGNATSTLPCRVAADQ